MYSIDNWFVCTVLTCCAAHARLKVRLLGYTSKKVSQLRSYVPPVAVSFYDGRSFDAIHTFLCLGWFAWLNNCALFIYIEFSPSTSTRPIKTARVIDIDSNVNSAELSARTQNTHSSTWPQGIIKGKMVWHRCVLALAAHCVCLCAACGAKSDEAELWITFASPTMYVNMFNSHAKGRKNRSLDKRGREKPYFKQTSPQSLFSVRVKTTVTAYSLRKYTRSSNITVFTFCFIFNQFLNFQSLSTDLKDLMLHCI